MDPEPGQANRSRPSSEAQPPTACDCTSRTAPASDQVNRALPLSLDRSRLHQSTGERRNSRPVSTTRTTVGNSPSAPGAHSPIARMSMLYANTGRFQIRYRFSPKGSAHTASDSKPESRADPSRGSAIFTCPLWWSSVMASQLPHAV